MNYNIIVTNKGLCNFQVICFVVNTIYVNFKLIFNKLCNIKLGFISIYMVETYVQSEFVWMI